MDKPTFSLKKINGAPQFPRRKAAVSADGRYYTKYCAALAKWEVYEVIKDSKGTQATQKLVSAPPPLEYPYEASLFNHHSEGRFYFTDPPDGKGGSLDKFLTKISSIDGVLVLVAQQYGDSVISGPAAMFALSASEPGDCLGLYPYDKHPYKETVENSYCCDEGGFLDLVLVGI
jgi:hypothetical protein